MPVIGHCNGHGIYVLSFDEITEISVYSTIHITVFSVDNVPSLEKSLFIDITNSHPLHLIFTEKIPHVWNTLHPESDSGHNNPITGSRCARLTQN